MSRKFLKKLLVLTLIIITISLFSCCYATEPIAISEKETKEVTTSDDKSAKEDTEKDTEEDTSEEVNPELYNGDIYLCGANIVVDKLIDGNAFVIGNNVKITGQINGSLFIIANTVSFDECYVRNAIFICANSVYYNGASNDLYVATNNLTMTYDSYVVRDVKATTINAFIKTAIGRDFDLKANSVDFGEGENIPVIYGNLRYSAKNKLEIPENVISADRITYTKSNIIQNYILVSSTVIILIGLFTYLKLSRKKQHNNIQINKDKKEKEKKEKKTEDKNNTEN